MLVPIGNTLSAYDTSMHVCSWVKSSFDTDASVKFFFARGGGL
jgi:hypothetical protein